MRCKDRVLFSKFSLCCLFFFLKREMTSSAHGRGTLCVLLQKLNCLAARYTLQALHLSTCARGAGIHGDVLTGHTEGRAVSSSVLLTKICPRRVITCFRGPPKKPVDLTQFQFENRSGATRCRFLQKFALPDKAVQFQQS